MITIILLAIVSMSCWAIWLVMSDISSQSYTPGQLYLYITFINLILSLIYVHTIDTGSVIPEDNGNIYQLVLTGLFSGLGSIIFYIAIDQSGQHTAVVYTITSLYFVFSVLLGWMFLGDIMELKDWVGLLLAVLAVILISI